MKKFKIKAFLGRHIEKIVFGLFALIVLGALSRTTWGVYKDRPEMLNQRIQLVKDKISAPENVWPDQAEFQIVDFSEKARQMLMPIHMDRYQLLNPLFHPLNKVDEPRREPKFLPVQSLIAKACLVALKVRIDPESTTPTVDPLLTAAETPVEEEDKQTAPRNGRNSPLQGTGVNGTAGVGMAGTGLGRGNRPSERGGAVPLFNAMRRNRDDKDEDDDGNSGLGSRPGLPSAGDTARGERCISVLGVFPLKEQLTNYMQALHISQAQAANDFEIADFVLERQVAKNGPDPWKDSKWTPVSVERASEILLEASEVDREDPVPPGMKDQVITMDLPSRMMGYWDDFATHPRIKDFLLKEEEINKMNLMLDSLDQTASATKLGEQVKARRRGLAIVQPDVKGLAKRIGSDPRAAQLMNSNFKRLQQGMPQRQQVQQADNDEDDNRGMRGMNQMLTSRNYDYLLFRYLDFEVLSGYAYRYRVRLVLHNPNFEIAPELLGGADRNIAEGEERDSPWSNISNAEVVPSTTRYFLEDVGRDPYRDEKVKVSDAIPAADLAMYDWDMKLGTIVASPSLKIFTIGGFIGNDKREEKEKEKKEKKEEKKAPEPPRGRAFENNRDTDDAASERPNAMAREERKETKKTPPKKNELLVLDLTQGGLVKKVHYFSTLDVLVDVEPDMEVIQDQHPELKFAMEKGRSGTARVNLVENALVSTSVGELKTLDTVTDRADKEKLIERVKKERMHYKEVALMEKMRPRNGSSADEDDDGRSRRPSRQAPRRQFRRQMNRGDK